MEWNISQVQLNTMDDLQLLKCLTEIANNHYDGHYSIFKFTTHYKVGFGTPNFLSVGWDLEKNIPEGGYREIHNMSGFFTLREALIHAILVGQEFLDELTE